MHSTFGIIDSFYRLASLSQIRPHACKNIAHCWAWQFLSVHAVCFC
uniref:Uncharacterized protein n=1 Tax=Arundo donax TaxID=35708 RepID=A0A0A9HVM2_ARUDO